MRDIVVIGAGPAGITTAMYVSRAGLDVVLIEKGLYGGQLNSTDMIENYTGFELVSGIELGESMDTQARKQDGVEHVFGEVNKVTQINKGFEIELGDKQIHAKSVVIATGVKHRRLGVNGEYDYDGNGISYCSICDGNFFKGRSVAVVGGGDSAVEASIYLSNIAKKVTLIHRRDELRAEAILQDRMFKEDNIEYIWDAEVESFEGVNDELTSIEYRDKNNPEHMKSLSVDGAFIYIGIEATTEPFEGLGVLSPDGFVVSNKRMQTPTSGIFAVGDIGEDSVRQIVTATGDGAIASDSVIRYLRGLK